MFLPMNRSEALETLRRFEPELRARGVRRAAVFGSVVRGDSRPDSDVDIMVEIDPEAHLTVFDYAGLKDYIASLFDGPVDVVNRDGLKPYVRPAASTGLEGIDRVGRRGGTDIGFEAVAVHHIDWTIKQARDVILEIHIVEHGEMRLRIDLDHDVDIAFRTAVAP